MAKAKKTETPIVQLEEGVKVNVLELQKGDMLGEIDRYVITNVNSETAEVHNLGNNQKMEVSKEIIAKSMFTSDQYQKEEKVGVLDKRYTEKDIAEIMSTITDEKEKNKKILELVTNPIKQRGIRSIFAGLDETKIFTCCFKKQDKDKTTKKYNEDLEAAKNDIILTIQKGATGQISNDEVDAKILETLKKPPLPYEEGEIRVVRGYKLDSFSNDGIYAAIDLEKMANAEKYCQIQITINNIQWLVVDGVKYAVA